ncbi:nipped-B-like protein B [Gigantopelta aegis]|uniref:nipped-B-like protein B n=1 Tax=Gigantopelta aegis TaxID=1735272 RepID=UPI001B888387|nr:nipped-B-like protein B [Gigantopelta aegis]
MSSDMEKDKVEKGMENGVKIDEKENSEENDLDLNDPELASAALKLQAGFRGRFKNRVKKPVKVEDDKSEGAAGQTEMRSYVHKVDEKKEIDKKEKSDEIDLDLNDPELASAALKLQAGFRGRFKNKVKKPVKVEDEKGEGNTEVTGQTEMRSDVHKVDDRKEKCEEIDLDLNDPELASAALKLQAGFRGRFKNRVKKPVKEDEKGEANREVKGQTEMMSDVPIVDDKKEKSEEIDLDLNDPELASAALKLQAGFRGRFKNRVKKPVKEDEKGVGNREVKGQTEMMYDVPIVDEKKEKSEEIDLDLNDPDLASAALKLQAGFRGRFKNRVKKPVKEDEKGEGNREVKSQTEMMSDVPIVDEKKEKSEEIDLDLNDPELAKTALKLQAGFRGRFSNKSKKPVIHDKKDEVTNSQTEHVEKEVKVQGDTKPSKTEDIDLDLNDPELANAALKLQAGFRGRFKNRAKKPVKDDAKGSIQNKGQTFVEDKAMTDVEAKTKVDNTVKVGYVEQTNEVDLDLNDPDLATAALKIQAGFRGRLKNKTQKSVQVCMNKTACRGVKILYAIYITYTQYFYSHIRLLLYQYTV